MNWKEYNKFFSVSLTENLIAAFREACFYYDAVIKTRSKDAIFERHLFLSFITLLIPIEGDALNMESRAHIHISRGIAYFSSPGFSQFEIVCLINKSADALRGTTSYAALFGPTDL